MRFDINFVPINWLICYLRIGGVYDKQRPLMFLLVPLLIYGATSLGVFLVPNIIHYN